MKAYKITPSGNDSFDNQFSSEIPCNEIKIITQLLPKIYKRTSTGKIQEWTIEIDGNKYRTISGQIDGKKVISNFTECKGKNIGKSNETTPEGQALAEATAKRIDKLSKEYKEFIKDIDTHEFLEPMLAKNYDPSEELEYPLFVQPKLDGCRCIANEKSGLRSRQNKPFIGLPHINKALEPIFVNLDIKFDGELYNHKLKDDFDELISMIRTEKPSQEDLEKAANFVRYYIYDIQLDNMIFSKRNKWLKYILEEKYNEHLIFVETLLVENKEQLEYYYNKFLEEGYEGLMIRRDTPYEHKRTKNLLKYKPIITKEFTIVEVLEGKGNRAGMAGKVVIRLDNGNTCEANPTGSFVFYKKLWNEKDKVIGLPAEIEFQNYTPSGSLRFPRMKTIRNYE